MVTPLLRESQPGRRRLQLDAAPGGNEGAEFFYRLVTKRLRKRQKGATMSYSAGPNSPGAGSPTAVALTDEELDELGDLAMADDPDRPAGKDAIALSIYLGTQLMVLPQWYMPPAVSRISSRSRRALVVAIVVALVMIDAWGLCSTYGWVSPA